MTPDPSPDAAQDAPVIAAFTDLLFGARIRAAAAAHGVRSVITTVPERLVQAVHDGARAVFIDLDTRTAEPAQLVVRLKADPATSAVPVVAFASHVRVEAIEAARNAGADRVLARRAFARLLPDLVRHPIAGP